MRITKVTLKNIRCFKELEIDLQHEGKPKRWMIALGENGVGKTTLLRSIALGLCEESGAAGLCAEVAGDWIHNGGDKGEIRLDILPFEGYTGEPAFVLTTLIRDKYDEVTLKQKTSPEDPKDFEWEKLFVCGYGSARSVYGSMDVSEYAVTDSVYTLFNYDTDLQNPELCLRRLIGEKVKMNFITNQLENILMLPPNSISLTKYGITVDGPWGRPMLIGTLGDGYRSTITWILDLFGWKLLAEDFRPNFELEGIVIIDELEKHLHPKWQKQLIGLLSRQFPKLQFIVSTHSPLCVVGTTELSDEDCVITVSKQESEAVITSITTPPRGRRVDQVLTSYLFQLYSTSDDIIRRNIERYNVLFNTKDKSPEQTSEQAMLYTELNNSLGSAETELESRVGAVLSQSLDSLFKEKVNKETSSISPEKFELLRQLKDLL